MSSDKKSKKETSNVDKDKSTKDSKSEELEKPVPESKSSGTYGITVEQLEELMSAYKERGNEYLDIKQIENFRRNRFNN
jgi:hypothetical protein